MYSPYRVSVRDQKLKDKLTGTGETAQGLRVLPVLAEEGVRYPASTSHDSK